MKNLITLFLLLVFQMSLFGQIGNNSNPTEEEVLFSLQGVLEDHDFLDELAIAEVIDIYDWMRAYSLSFPEPETQADMAATVIYKTVASDYRNESVLVSLATNIDIRPRTEVESLMAQIQQGTVSAEEAVSIIETMATVSREVIAMGVYNAPRFLPQTIEILTPNGLQYLDAEYEIDSDLANAASDLVFDVASGASTVPIKIYKNGQTYKEVESLVYDGGEAELYKKQHDPTYLKNHNLPPCVDWVEDFFSYQLPPGILEADGLHAGDWLHANTLLLPSYDGVLDNILLITDGIDFTGSTGVKEVLNGFGGADTFEDLLGAGIDIMFVDWPLPMGRIEHNSSYLQGLIKDLNTRPDFESIVAYVGISMGGIIGRHALLELENESYTHNVDVYVSGDSPQEGANVSVGVQAAIVEGNMTKETDAGTFMASIINSPAARQMMRFQVSLDDYSFLEFGRPVFFINKKAVKNAALSAHPDPLFTQLQAYLDANGYPQQTTTNASIADGSMGISVVSVGQQIVDLEGGKIKSFATDGIQITFPFNAKIILRKDYSWISSTYLTALENSTDNIDTGAGSTLSVTRFEGDGVEFVNEWCYQPTTSALGIPGSVHNTDYSSTPFDTYYLDPTTNDPHSTFSEDKIQFLIDNMDPALFDNCVECALETTFVTERTEGWADRFWQFTNNGYQLYYMGVNHINDPDNFYVDVHKDVLDFDIATTNFPDFVESVSVNELNDQLYVHVEFDLDEIENDLENLPMNLDQEQIKIFFFRIRGTVSYESCTGTASQLITIPVLYKYYVYDTDALIPFASSSEEGQINMSGQSDNTGENFDFSKLDANIELQMNNEASEFILYPNPALNTLIIKQSNFRDSEHFILFDQLGKQLKLIRVGSDQYEINITELESGVYFIKSMSGKGSIKRFIKL